MRPDFSKVGAIIAEVAEIEMIPHYRNLPAGAVKTKESPNDLVTMVDHAMEKALMARLGDLSPATVFIGEEAAAANPAIADQIATAERCWIVDPLDGTRNFVNHVDEFGSIVAYVERGETIAGWIYAAPLRSLAACVKGEGVWWNGVRVKTLPQSAERPTGLRSTGWLNPEWRDRLSRTLKLNVTSLPGHCSAYGYLKLIKGEIDFKQASRVHAWDHAAGALVVDELGGAVRWLGDGVRYRPGQSADRPLLATAPGRDWDEIARLLLDE